MPLPMQDERANGHGQGYAASTRHGRHAGVQLANAILTQNRAAVNQLLTAYGEQLDIDFIDGSQLTPLQQRQQRRTQPVTSLAILTNQDEIALMLVERGADVTQSDLQLGRTVLYIAIESGRYPLVESILNMRPNLDLTTPLSREAAAYHSLHIAAR